NDDPAQLLDDYLSIYVAPGLSDTDYNSLTTFSAPGGFIERFVFFGGEAVINIAPDPAATLVLRPGLAPGGVGLQPQPTSNNLLLVNAIHPYFTGQGYAGVPLTSSAFSGWDSTNDGF